MKKRVIFLIAACLCALCCASAAAESVTLTAVVPEEHAVTVIIGEHGSIQCGDQQYSGTASIAVQRFGSANIAVVPDYGYELDTITASSGEYLAYDEAGITISGIAEDLFIELSFVSTHSGQCGDDVYWALDDEGTLTISGSGAMQDYTAETSPFHEKSFSRVIIEEGVTSVGSYAFYDCSALNSVTLPQGMTGIGDSAFRLCWNLNSIEIPAGVTAICQYAFSGCTALREAILPDGLISIGNYAFNKCSRLSSITLPEGVTIIGDAAFRNCKSLSGIVIPGSVTSIGAVAFSGCSGLTSISIPDGITGIGRYTFYGCGSLTDISIPDSVTSIGSYAFDGCDSLQTVAANTCGTYVYYWAKSMGYQVTVSTHQNLVVDAAVEPTCAETGLTEGSHCPICGVLVAQETVPKKGHYYVFDAEVEPTCTETGMTSGFHCDRCGEVFVAQEVVPATGHAWGEPSYTWAEDDSAVTATRVCGHDAAHVETEEAAVRLRILSPTDSAPGMADYSSEPFSNDAFEIQAKTIVIPSLQSMTVLRLPASLTAIEAEAFCGDDSIEAVLISSGCASIGSRAFADCVNLRYVRVPASVTSIADDAFEGCGQVIVDRITD